MYHENVSELFRLIHEYFNGCPVDQWRTSLDPLTTHFMIQNHLTWNYLRIICGG